MKREIKFRAWSTVTKSFTDAFVFDVSTGVLTPATKSCILTQYTGLKDKNGKEVYEGDIVTGVVKAPQLLTGDTDENCNTKMGGVVFYDYCGFSLDCQHTQYLCDGDREGMCNYFSFIDTYDGDFGEMEIIGNIYEDGHLLEGQGSRDKM